MRLLLEHKGVKVLHILMGKMANRKVIIVAKTMLWRFKLYIPVNKHTPYVWPLGDSLIRVKDLRREEKSMWVRYLYRPYKVRSFWSNWRSDVTCQWISYIFTSSSANKSHKKGHNFCVNIGWTKCLSPSKTNFELFKVRCSLTFFGAFKAREMKSKEVNYSKRFSEKRKGGLKMSD